MTYTSNTISVLNGYVHTTTQHVLGYPLPNHQSRDHRSSTRSPASVWIYTTNSKVFCTTHDLSKFAILDDAKDIY